MAALAKRIGVNRSTVTRVCRERLRPAMLPNGRVDARHGEVRRWARSRGVDPRSLLDPVTNSHEAPGPAPAPARTAPIAPSPDDLAVEGLLDLTLRQITDRFGSPQGLRDWLAARRQVADVARITARTEREAGLLISRELVRRYCILAFEELFGRLLGEVAEGLAITVPPLLTREARVQAIRSVMSTQLTTAKRKIATGIRASVVLGDQPPPPVMETEIDSDAVRDGVRRSVLAELQAMVPETAAHVVALPPLSPEEHHRRVVALLTGTVGRASRRAEEQDAADRAKQELDTEIEKELSNDDDG
jgi:hypothetical protein